MRILLLLIAIVTVTPCVTAAEVTIHGYQATEAYGGFGGEGGMQYRVEYFFHKNGAVLRYHQNTAKPDKFGAVVGLWVKDTGDRFKITWYNIDREELAYVGTETLRLDPKADPIKFQVEQHTDNKHVDSYSNPKAITKSGKAAEHTINSLAIFPKLVSLAQERTTDDIKMQRQLDEIHRNFNNALRRQSNEFGRSLGLIVIE